MRTTRSSHERGSVMVLTAAAMFPIVFLMAYAIDVSHWFDYSRNLQNRADAAALAAGDAFGNTCLEGGSPGDVMTGAQSVIGKWAQLYSGAGVGEPSGWSAGTPYIQLPYTNGAVSAPPTQTTGTGPGTGWSVATNGYLNNTLAASPVASPLTLKLGKLNDYWLVLNGNDYAEHHSLGPNRGTSFSMKAGGLGATFCSSDPKQDLTDPNAALAGPAGPMVDVKVSQRRLPLFFPLISGRPTLHAHARVEFQGEASSPRSRPIAVSDPGFTPCVSVDFIDANPPHAVIKTAVLTAQPVVNPTDPIVWNNAAVQPGIPGTGPANFSSWPTDNVYVQAYLNNCNGTGQRYDDATNTGLLYINSHPQSNPTVGTGNPPALGSNGVFLTTGNCAPDQYFSVGDCKDTITAGVKFDPAIARNRIFVTAVDHTWDPTANGGLGGFVTSAPLSLRQDNSDLTLWNSAPGNPNLLSVLDQSGIHEIEIKWEQQAGSVTGKGACNTSGTNPCQDSFGIQTQAFGACNGCDQPDDSGPMVLAQLGQASAPGTFGANSFARGSNQSLVVTLKLAGLSAAKAGDPATILRFPVSGNHQTGFVDCTNNGTGSGANVPAYVYYGCGPGNPVVPGLNPLFVNTRNTCGTPPGPPWPPVNHQDCVQTTPGTRRTNIICPLVDRIISAPFGTNCNTNNSTAGCPDNTWPLVLAGSGRAITMMLTAPADLASADGAPQFWIPIRRFATFYVTGWDSKIKPQCPGNESFPGKGHHNNQDAAVWGHWTNYVEPGIGNGIPGCDTSSGEPTNCVPVLTR